jgi:hypothetical protein
VGTAALGCRNLGTSEPSATHILSCLTDPLHCMRQAAVGDFGLELIEFNSKVRPQAIK